ncbi:ribonuclease P protein subunit p29 [Neoarius graeffei]|uniref:ribonuclease P protein subunit p29 n=1 Tax=Neoarius graeffei TaxID=443677 RepID=UPI00298BEB04|nr:ribonuclease P protein subunit p29 [Neoarius graeffei]
MASVILSTLPPDEGELLGVQPQHGEAAEKFTRAFLRSQKVESVLQHQGVVMQYTRKWKRKGKKTKAKGLSAKERRALGVFELKPEHQKYELFLPLHDLWKQYITELCSNLRAGSNLQVMEQKLLKADFHGAILTVVRSKCPSYVGSTGILVQELKHVFKIITKENRLKTIPKRNSVFSVEIGDFVTHIYGSKFEFRSSVRSAKKFKMSGTIDL